MGKERIKLGFSGGPASGKSTQINYYRENRPDITVVDEAARDFFRLNPRVNRKSLETQKLILEHMIGREEAAWAFGSKIVVTDRTAVDQLVYPRHYGIAGSEELVKDAKNHLYTYDKLYLCDIEGVPYVQDEIRTETAEERQKIHEMFLIVLAELGVEYHLLTGEPHERVMMVDRHINLLQGQ